MDSEIFFLKKLKEGCSGMRGTSREGLRGCVGGAVVNVRLKKKNGI